MFFRVMVRARAGARARARASARAGLGFEWSGLTFSLRHLAQPMHMSKMAQTWSGSGAGSGQG